MFNPFLSILAMKAKAIKNYFLVSQEESRLNSLGSNKPVGGVIGDGALTEVPVEDPIPVEEPVLEETGNVEQEDEVLVSDETGEVVEPVEEPVVEIPTVIEDVHSLDFSPALSLKTDSLTLNGKVTSVIAFHMDTGSYWENISNKTVLEGYLSDFEAVTQEAIDHGLKLHISPTTAIAKTMSSVKIGGVPLPQYLSDSGVWLVDARAHKTESAAECAYWLYEVGGAKWTGVLGSFESLNDYKGFKTYNGKSYKWGILTGYRPSLHANESYETGLMETGFGQINILPGRADTVALSNLANRSVLSGYCPFVVRTWRFNVQAPSDGSIGRFFSPKRHNDPTKSYYWLDDVLMTLDLATPRNPLQLSDYISVANAAMKEKLLNIIVDESKYPGASPVE